MRRLRDRWLWLRHAWFFEWAHKPLCDNYREDVLTLGELRLCRGCSALWAGVLSGTLLVVLAPFSASVWEIAGSSLFALSVALSYPTLHSRWPRPVRDILRFATGLLPPLAVALAVRGEWAFAAPALALLALTYIAYAYMRQRTRLSKCAHCDEFGAGICSGYELQSHAIRKWEEAASRREVERRLARGL